MFDVEVHGLFVRRADVEQRVAQPFRSHHRFEVDRTRVPGVRFTTKCAEPGLTSDGEDPEEGTEDCGFAPAIYWRDQSMFPSLAGVDWLAMERSRSDERLEAFVKRNGGFIPGSADSIRVRVYRADGTLVRDAIEGFTPPWKSPVTAWSNGVARTLYSTSPASLDLQPGEASIGLQRSSAFPGLKLSWYEPLIVLTERGSGR